MPEASLVLFIDLEPDTKVDLRAAAKAAIAWADLVEQVGAFCDPLAPVSFKLEGARPGSQKLKAVVQSLVGDSKTAIRTAIISAVIFLAKDTVTWTWEQALEWISGPDAPEQSQELSQAEREAIAKEVVSAIQKRMAHDTAQRVYDELERDTNVTGVGISGHLEGRPSRVVPRASFPPKVYMVEESGTEKRAYVQTVDLVLLRPVLTKETTRRWGFAWPHGTFGATIKDSEFLGRLASGAIIVPMVEGIVFTVELEISEERIGDVWTAKDYSVKKVLNVRPPLQQSGFGLEPPQ